MTTSIVFLFWATVIAAFFAVASFWGWGWAWTMLGSVTFFGFAYLFVGRVAGKI